GRLRHPERPADSHHRGARTRDARRSGQESEGQKLGRNRSESRSQRILSDQQPARRARLIRKTEALVLVGGGELGIRPAQANRHKVRAQKVRRRERAPLRGPCPNIGRASSCWPKSPPAFIGRKGRGAGQCEIRSRGRRSCRAAPVIATKTLDVPAGT